MESVSTFQAQPKKLSQLFKEEGLAVVRSQIKIDRDKATSVESSLVMILLP